MKNVPLLKLEHIPQKNLLVNREIELEKLTNFLNENTIVIVFGLTGIGKTHLVAELCHRLSTKKKVFWSTISNETLPEILLSQLNIFLLQYEEKTFSKVLKNSLLSFQEKISSLIEILNKEEYILCFDSTLYTIQNEGIKLFLNLLRNGLSCSKLILVTHKIPDFLTRGPGKADFLLNELLMTDAIKFLQAYGLEDELPETLQMIVEKIGGIPLSLILFTAVVKRHWYNPIELLREIPRFRDDIDKFLFIKLFNDLSEQEKNILLGIAIFRGQCTKEMIRTIYKGEEFKERFNSVVNFFNIEFNGGYQLHQTIADLCRFQIKNLKELGIEAGELYMKMSNSVHSPAEYNIEAYYHYINATDYNKGVMALVVGVEKLINSGYANYLKNEFSHYTSNMLENLSYGWLCWAKGKTYIGLNNLYEARDSYGEMMRTFTEVKNNYGILIAMLALSDIYYRENNLEEAIKSYKETVSLAEKGEEKKVLWQVYQNLANIFRQMGDEPKSKYYLDCQKKLSAD